MADNSGDWSLSVVPDMLEPHWSGIEMFVVGKGLFSGNWIHIPPPPGNANNIGECTFIMLICTDQYTPIPHCVM